MPTVKLPDFDDMIEYANSISDLLKRKLILETEISMGESTAVQYAMANVKINEKPPSMEYIKNTFLVEGIQGMCELLPLRKEHAEVAAELERKRLLLQIFRDMLEVYRTESANERAASLA
jgi:hypothetical protein